MDYMKKIISAVVVVALIIGGFGAGFWYGKNSQPSIEKVTGVINLEQGKPQSIDFTLFWDAWEKVQDKYVNREKLDYQQMVYGAISGMLKSLGDPYTVFMTPQENKDFSQALQGNFEGIGAEIGIRNDILTVISPLENSPSKKAGLLAGDKILKIDDTVTADLTADQAVSLIRGTKGTQVRLTIARDSWTSAQEITITRDVIDIPVTKFEIKQVDTKPIAYLALYHFTENSYQEFAKAAQQILTSGVKGIVLDLRDDPGGYLDAAVDIASWFLPEDELVVTEDYGNNKKIEHRSTGINKLGSYPVVVLINEGSASASEILAGALRDNIPSVKLVGEKSFGKGSVQEFQDMNGGTSIKITVAKWLTPAGHSIADEGLEPDVKVDITKEDIDNGRDPQLDKALELFK